MNAVVNIDEAPTSGLVQMIERLAINPDVDVAKLEKLLELQERILDRNAKTAFTSALAQMQPELPVITEKGEILNKQGLVQSRYALWEDINAAIKPALAKYGFALSFRTGFNDSSEIVTAVLSHRDGHSEETSMRLPSDKSGSKNDVQAVGSSISYGKRYTAGALLNITSTGEDNDAQNPLPPAPEGYANWKADIGCIADEGIKRLQEVWLASEKIFRIYATDFDHVWWAETKTKAAKVKA